MKKLIQKAAVLVLTLAVLVTTIPVSVMAAPYVPESQTVYRYGKGVTSTSIYVGGLSKSQTIKKSSVKSSDPSVVKPGYLQKSSNSYNYETQYFDDTAPSKTGSNNYSYSIGLKLLKKGSSRVSFQIDNKKYETTVNVKDYTNPLKTVKIAGLKNGKSTNLASKLKSQNTTNLKLTKNKSNAIIEVAVKSGWKLTGIELYSPKESAYYSVRNYAKGVSGAKLHVGTLKKNQPYQVKLEFKNTKDNGTLTSYYYINYKKTSYGYTY